MSCIDYLYEEKCVYDTDRDYFNDNIGLFFFLFRMYLYSRRDTYKNYIDEIDKLIEECRDFYIPCDDWYLTIDEGTYVYNHLSEKLRSLFWIESYTYYVACMC